MSMAAKHKDVKLPDVPSLEALKEELAREKAKCHFRRSLWNVAVVLLVVAAVTVLVATRLLVLIQINGDSMSPALEAGEVVFLYQTKEIEKGDIVGFYYGGRILLKRVIGCGGDQIEMDRDGNVYVNGEPLAEPYLTEKSLGKCNLVFPYQVPEGMLFVLGDNRPVSVDSRTRALGCVEESQIVGKAVFRAWPLERVGFMR